MKTKNVPMRRCIGCRQSRPKIELIRIVRTPDARICVDKTGKMNGRGAYICRDGECLKKALKAGALSAALDTKISSEDVASLSEALAQADTVQRR